MEVRDGRAQQYTEPRKASGQRDVAVITKEKKWRVVEEKHVEKIAMKCH